MRLAPGEVETHAHHVVHIYVNPEGDREIDLFHPGGCGRADGYCPIEEYADSIGMIELFDQFEDGFHRVASWIQGGGWITGDHAIEWDVGVDDAGPPQDWWEAGRPDPASWEPHRTWYDLDVSLPWFREITEEVEF